MTLEAWVRPSSISGWKAVLQKMNGNEGLSYAIYAGTPTDLPSGHVNITSERRISSTAALGLNTWSHLALTYDGATVRFYVGGVQMGSLAVSGSMVTTTGALRIGGNGPSGAWFQGLIDDLRIYNRALSPAEIQTDMTTPVSP
jgi:hypothetical protein